MAERSLVVLDLLQLFPSNDQLKVVFYLALTSVRNRVGDLLPLISVLQPLAEELNVLACGPARLLQRRVERAYPSLSALLAFSQCIVFLSFDFCHHAMELGGNVLPSHSQMLVHDLCEDRIFKCRPLHLRALFLLDEQPAVLALLGILVGEVVSDRLPISSCEVLRKQIGTVHGLDHQVLEHLRFISAPLGLAGDLHGLEGLGDAGGLQV